MSAAWFCWTAAAASRWLKGDTFTISDVYDVNPVSKETLAHLKMFTVMSTSVTSASNEADVEIWPPLILSGAQKTCHLSTGTDINDNTITYQGTPQTIQAAQAMVASKIACSEAQA